MHNTRPLTLALLLATAAACARPASEAASAPAPAAAKAAAPAARPAGEAAKPRHPRPNKGPTQANALAFLEQTERDLLELWIHRERTDSVKATHITHDTELLAAKAEEQVMAFVAGAATKAMTFKDLELPADAQRKLKLLRTAQTLPEDRPHERTFLLLRGRLS